jgi:hypothetical protein
MMFPSTLSLLTNVFTARRERRWPLAYGGRAPGWGSRWARSRRMAAGTFWWGSIILMTQYFQVVRGYSPLATGVRLLPAAVSVGVASVAGTRLAVRIGNKIIVGGGMLLFCVALLWISTASRFTAYGIIAAQMVMLGVGMGFTQAPATEAIMGAVPTPKAGIASAVNGSTRLFGSTLGVAVIGSVAASLYTSRLTALLPSDLPDRAVAVAKGSVGGAEAAAQQLSRAGLAGPGHRLADAAAAAFMYSLTRACLVAAGAAAGGVLLVAFWLPPARAPSRPTPSQPRAPCRPPGRQVITPPRGRQLILAPRHNTAERSQNRPRHHLRLGAGGARRLRAACDRRGAGQSRAVEHPARSAGDW